MHREVYQRRWRSPVGEYEDEDEDDNEDEVERLVYSPGALRYRERGDPRWIVL